jgi:hypothetical protein
MIHAEKAGKSKAMQKTTTFYKHTCLCVNYNDEFDGLIL